LVEQDGRYWITETQKSIARVHEVDATLLEGLWNQRKVRKITQEGLVLSLNHEELQTGKATMPILPDLRGGGGFSIDLRMVLDDLSPGQIIFDSRDEQGKGIVLATGEQGTIRIDLSDGTTTSGWGCDPELPGCGTVHHITAIVDGGPKIVTFVVDGVLCDGGTHRQYGWGRFNKELGDVNGSEKLRIAPSLNGKVKVLRIYDRYLRTSEAIANFHAHGTG
jgi:hypothetical protein